MPIPTKSTSTTGARLGASKRTISIQDKDKATTSTSLKTPTNTASTSAPSRLLPRPISRDARGASTTTSTLPTSVNTTTNNLTTDTTSASSRPSSTSSSTSRSAVRPAQTQSTRSTIKSRVTGTTTSLARTTSTSKPTGTTALDAKASASKLSRVNPTSTVPATTTRSLRAPIATNKLATRTTSASSTATTKSITTKSKPEPSLPTAAPPCQSTTNLSNELDQLHLLHETSRKTLNEYKQSATQRLTSIHASLQSQQTTLIALESSTLEAISTDALETWLLDAEARGHQPSRIIQTLSSTIQELDRLANDTDESAPLKQFETWLDNVLSIRADRGSRSKSVSKLQSSELQFIHPLSRAWTESITDLRQTISDLLATLTDLAVSNPDPNTGIGTLIARYQVLARVLLEEAETAIMVERGIVEDEKGWERKEIERVMAELSCENNKRGDGSLESELGIWGD